MPGAMDKLKLTGLNLAKFSSLDLSVFVQAMNCTHFVKQNNLKLKTRPKQLLGFLPLAHVRRNKGGEKEGKGQEGVSSM